MPVVRFTRNLERFYPDLKATEVEGATVAEVISALESLYPGLPAYLIDETGALRQHVNIFIGDEIVSDKRRLSDTVRAGDEIFVLQALSGG